MNDKILCPWCGAEMRTITVPLEKNGKTKKWNAWMACKNIIDCQAEGPFVQESTPEEAMESAKAAALRRYTPPKPLEEDDANKAQMPEWISVKDKLPENDSHYLVFASDTCEVVDCIYCGDGEWMTKDLENMTDCVTHWMPLPKHPEEGALNGV